jgi:hypothetical protein
LWVYAREQRPWSGPEPPAAVYLYAPDRKAERPASHLEDFKGVLHVDGYAGFEQLANNGDVVLAACWAHTRRKFYEVAEATGSPVAVEALRRIAELYVIEVRVRGKSSAHRLAERRSFSKPIVQALHAWLEAQLSRVAGRSTLAEAIRYARSRWEGLTRVLHDGRIELDTNPVERAIRPVAMGDSLCNPSSSICKHWKHVFARRSTRATLSGNRSFHLVRLQVSGTDLVWRAPHDLFGRQRAGLYQAPDHVAADPKMFCGFPQRQPFTIFLRRPIGVNVAHLTH